MMLIFRKPWRVPHRNFRGSLKGLASAGSKDDWFVWHCKKQRKPVCWFLVGSQIPTTRS